MSFADRFEAARGGDAAALERGRFRVAQPPGRFRKVHQRLVQAPVRIARDQHHAHFLRAHRCDIKLAAIAPVDLHELAPGRGAIMAPETEAPAVALAGVQAGPAAHRRLSAIGAHDPARANQLAVGDYAFFRDAGDARAPGHPHADVGGAAHHHGVQGSTAQAQPVALGEGGLDRNAPLAKANAAERVRAGGVEIDPQRLGGGPTIRHDAFPASLIDGRNGTVRHGHHEAAQACGDSGGQARGAAADYEYVGGARERHAVRRRLRGAPVPWLPPRSRSSCGPGRPPREWPPRILRAALRLPPAAAPPSAP